MQHDNVSCQLGAPARRQIDTIAPLPSPLQWASATPGRIVTDPYSWMQAVHWVNDAGVYQPSRSHGPQWGETTLRLAQLLADLNPCRPTIEYLMRRLKSSERTVQYHLDMLREVGLLAYMEKGTRRAAIDEKRVECRASQYAWIAPMAFDEALGIRTAGEGSQRRAVGIAEHGRDLIADLAKKATRKIKKRRASRRRCTPMEGGTTSLPKLSDGGDVTTTGTARVEDSAPTKTSTKSGSRKAGSGTKRSTILGIPVTVAMLAGGDRFARAARRSVQWVRGASHDQLRWVSNDPVARGWTEQQYVTWLHELGSAKGYAGLLWTPERPHALIAHALREEQQVEQEHAETAASGRIPWEQSTAYREAQQEAANLASLEALFAVPAAAKPQRTDADRKAAQVAGRCQPQRILDHRDEHGVDDAFDLYGVHLVAWAARLEASTNIRGGIHA